MDSATFNFEQEEEWSMDKCLKNEICAALRLAAKQSCCLGHLYEAEKRVRKAFGMRLPSGTTVVPEPMREYAGSVLRTVVTTNQITDECAVTSVGITFFVGGRLTTLKADDQGDVFCQYEGVGRGFKFIPHNSSEGLLGPQHFTGEGFSYAGEQLALSKSRYGTVARIKSDVRGTFMTSGLCLVADGRVEDLRLYADAGKMVDDLRALYEELISGDVGEWDRIFLLLHSS